MKSTRQLHELGQSLWLDNITRTLLDDGTLARYIAEDSITGLAGEGLLTELALEDRDVRQQSVVAQVTSLRGTGSAYEVLVVAGHAGLKYPALHRDRPHPPATWSILRLT